MARPERFELPTTWFVVLQSNPYNSLFLLSISDNYCPIVFTYMPLYALNYRYLAPFIGQLRRQRFTIIDQIIGMITVMGFCMPICRMLFQLPILALLTNRHPQADFLQKLYI